MASIIFLERGRSSSKVKQIAPLAFNWNRIIHRTIIIRQNGIWCSINHQRLHQKIMVLKKAMF